jgi:glycine dehydrogenase subunit 1
MSYISLSDRDKKEMLARIGVASPDDLFCCIPESIRMKRELRLPPPLSEPELLGFFGAVGRKNRENQCLSFLGAGAYRHHIPAVVDYLSSRGEFLSPYTPYQPEVSQGTLQVIFEYQTLVCQLTGMEIANASLYDGASAAAEAVLMAERIKGRPKILVAGSVHPQYKEVIRTYVKNLPIRIEEIAPDAQGQIDLEALGRAVDDQTSAVVCQSPNFLGVVETLEGAADIAHRHQALFVVLVAEAVSLGILKAPGACGADIVAGEGQSWGIPLSFGGPYLGFMACRQDSIRQFPGRIAGETKDTEGNRGFVLTLSTREQHIRREKATSNICTNQGLNVLAASVYMATLGKNGLRKVAELCYHKAHYAAQEIAKIPGFGLLSEAPFFNEFVVRCPLPASELNAYLLDEWGIVGGFEVGRVCAGLEDCLMFCVTEMNSREEIDELVEALAEVASDD